MSFSISQTAICFIACHGGPADHFATFSQNLSDVKTVEFFAAGPALKKLQERGIEVKNPFSVERISAEEEDALAKLIAKTCSACSVVITDVGHAFDIKLQEALSEHATHVYRLAYYDNPEPFVPGGYSHVASQVMLAAQAVLFANSNLATSPVFQEPDKEIEFGNINKIGIGYYPIAQAEKTAERRSSERVSLRHQLLLKNGIAENNQKIFVYFGGNNDEYFGAAFPAFLSLLKESTKRSDLSNIIFVLQQHPGAKGKNLDANMVSNWVSQCKNVDNAPKIIISDFGSDDAQVVADAAFYYQTSMGPQFVLAGIPTVQIGHEPFQDILVRNDLSPSVTNVHQFLEVIANLAHPKKVSQEVILESLGIKENWLQILKNAILVNSDVT